MPDKDKWLLEKEERVAAAELGRTLFRITVLMANFENRDDNMVVCLLICE